MKNSIRIVGALLSVLLIVIGQRDKLPPLPIPIPHVIVEDKPLISGDGLHVLIVADKLTLSREHDVVVNSKELQGWFGEHHAQWHIWAPSMDTTSEPPEWQAAMKLPRASAPWLIVSEKGKPNFNGPLPTTVAATIDVLRKYE